MLQDHQIIQKLSKHKAKCVCHYCPNRYVVNIYDARKSNVGHLCYQCKNRITNMTVITQAELLAVFSYCPYSGEITRKLDTLQGTKGNIATYSHSGGYRSMSIGGKEYLAHRVIWMMQTGEWPVQIDHIDHDRSNNRWLNMRDVGSRENQMNMRLRRNNTSGVQGVRKLPSGKYQAFIMVNRKQVGLGSYKTLDEAAAARKAADVKYGFHVNHGV